MNRSIPMSIRQVDMGNEEVKVKTRIIVYGGLLVFLSFGIYFIITKAPAPTGLAKGKIMKYYIAKDEIFTPRITANDKGFVTCYKENGKITVEQFDAFLNTLLTFEEGVSSKGFPKGVINKSAWINDMRLSSSPYGMRYCLVWTEVTYDEKPGPKGHGSMEYPKTINIYYKYIKPKYGYGGKIEGYESKVKQIEEIKLDMSPKEVEEMEGGWKNKFLKTDALSHLQVVRNDYTSGKIEFSIFYISHETPKLVNIDSDGGDSPIKVLPFTITPKDIRVINNENEMDRVYTLINHTHVNEYRMIQFDDYGNILQDKDIILDDIFNPKNMYFAYNKANDKFHLIVSQNDYLYFIIMDYLGNVWETKQLQMSSTFFGEFDIVDRGKCYDIIYAHKIGKETMGISLDSISYTGNMFKNSNVKLYSFFTYADTVAPIAAFSKSNYSILYKMLESKGNTPYYRVLLAALSPLNLADQSVKIKSKVPLKSAKEKFGQF